MQTRRRVRLKHADLEDARNFRGWRATRKFTRRSPLNFRVWGSDSERFGTRTHGEYDDIPKFTSFQSGLSIRSLEFFSFSTIRYRRFPLFYQLLVLRNRREYSSGRVQGPVTAKKNSEESWFRGCRFVRSSPNFSPIESVLRDFISNFGSGILKIHFQLASSTGFLFKSLMSFHEIKVGKVSTRGFLPNFLTFQSFPTGQGLMFKQNSIIRFERISPSVKLRRIG